MKRKIILQTFVPTNKNVPARPTPTTRGRVDPPEILLSFQHNPNPVLRNQPSSVVFQAWDHQSQKFSNLRQLRASRLQTSPSFEKTCLGPSEGSSKSSPPGNRTRIDSRLFWSCSSRSKRTGTTTRASTRSPPSSCSASPTPTRPFSTYTASLAGFLRSFSAANSKPKGSSSPCGWVGSSAGRARYLCRELSSTSLHFVRS